MVKLANFHGLFDVADFAGSSDCRPEKQMEAAAWSGPRESDRREPRLSFRGTEHTILAHRFVSLFVVVNSPSIQSIRLIAEQLMFGLEPITYGVSRRTRSLAGLEKFVGSLSDGF